MKCKPYHKCLATLSNELRIKIIEELQKGPKSVGELAEKTGTEQSKISHALQSLKECRFVISSKKGKERIYSLSSNIFMKSKKNKNLFEIFEEHYKNVCKCNCVKKKLKK